MSGRESSSSRLVLSVSATSVLRSAPVRHSCQGAMKEGLDLCHIGLTISEVRAAVVGVGNHPKFLRFPRRRVQALRIARVHHPIVLPVNNQDRARRDGRDIPQGLHLAEMIAGAPPCVAKALSATRASTSVCQALHIIATAAPME